MLLPKSDTHFEKWAEKGYYQRHTLLTAMAHVVNWDMALDIGGHVGFMANDKAKFFGVVHSFEPQPENYRCLRRNVPQNVETHNVALSDAEGLGRMESPKLTNSGAWELRDGIDVRVKTLDSYGFDNIGFIKIDVQGHEMKVLMGGVETLKRNRPVMLVECPKPQMLAFRQGGNPPDVVLWLASIGYTAVNAVNNDVIFVRGSGGV